METTYKPQRKRERERETRKDKTEGFNYWTDEILTKAHPKKKEKEKAMPSPVYISYLCDKGSRHFRSTELGGSLFIPMGVANMNTAY